MSDRINILIEKLREHKMTAQELSEQRISFVFGNSPKEDQSTKEEVREAVTTAKVA